MAGANVLHFPMTKGKPLRILIADDNLSMRNAIRRVLEEVHNVEVCAVTADGIEAVDAATALKPDLLILDAVMPGLTGVEVAGIVKKRLPSSKVILFTMYEEAVGKVLRKSAGVDLVIEKSKGLSLLTEKIRSAVAEIA
jgi:DNA-binding NarL/FixJ family response regulator